MLLWSFEHMLWIQNMLWIQSMPRMPYDYVQVPIGWNGMNMPTIMCVPMYIGRVYFKARGVKKDSVPDMIKVELTYVPIKGQLVFSHVNRPWSSLPMMLKLSGVEVCPVCRLCTWVGEGSFRCSLHLSPSILDVSPMYSSSQAISPHW